ncbi:proliferating cell nuclear antigen family protein [Cavenderia fasciculata]|uniref:Proliferating cell nuclear antigen family protein n=1 Tax=Cavenderia fasciculata TaxID=261658 RepID=F4PH85_CACFS|nr:proliferating cell nuclear antigen family protein [Cavenderia fasciculata]EGG25069.1 proliferating cell nuclear antigen family protein [Cavenderia fasciculata]|eukprot:XP_004362920.1 proliferating cell nuclear antigen family protein [Cavenderia fasciculata]
MCKKKVRIRGEEYIDSRSSNNLLVIMEDIFKGIVDDERAGLVISNLLLLNDFLDSVNIEINEKGWSLTGFDRIYLTCSFVFIKASQVLYIDVRLERSMFTDYHILKPVLFVLKVDMIHKVLKKVGKVEKIAFKYPGDKLELIIFNPSGFITHHSFPEMILQSPDQYKDPDFKYECEILLPCILFKNIIGELKSFGDNRLWLKVDENSLCFEANDSIVKSSMTLHKNIIH